MCDAWMPAERCPGALYMRPYVGGEGVDEMSAPWWKERPMVFTNAGDWIAFVHCMAPFQRVGRQPAKIVLDARRREREVMMATVREGE